MMAAAGMFGGFGYGGMPFGGAGGGGLAGAGGGGTINPMFYPNEMPMMSAGGYMGQMMDGGGDALSDDGSRKRSRVEV